MAGNGDRYEPLPPITRLPAYLWRRLGRRGRVGLLATAAAALLIGGLAIRGLRESNEESQAREARAAAEQRDRRLRELNALVRPRALRTASVARLESAITLDARRRTGDRILRTDCERLAEPGADRVKLSCLATTAELPRGRGVSSGGSVGHPYRALADFARGRVVYCQVFGVAGEGALTSERPVTIPRACGG